MLDRLIILAKWTQNIVVLSIFTGKGDIRNCICYGTIMLLEHAMKVMEKVLEKMLHTILTANKMYFMSDKGTIDDVFVLKRLQEENHAR